jgi:hypothetical protein
MRNLDAAEHPVASDLTAAVFSNGSGGLVVIRMEADADESAAASAVAQGYSFFAGYIAVIAGVPRAQCEPGFEVEFANAGLLFAGLLGEHLKQHRLAEQTTIRQ